MILKWGDVAASSQSHLSEVQTHGGFLPELIGRATVQLTGVVTSQGEIPRQQKPNDLMTFKSSRTNSLLLICKTLRIAPVCALPSKTAGCVQGGRKRKKEKKKPNAICTIVGRFCPSYHASLKLGHRRENPMSQCCTAGVFKKQPLIVTAYGRRPRRLISSGRGSACVNRSWP